MLRPYGLIFAERAVSERFERRLIGSRLYDIFDGLQTMGWLEQKIRRYEHMRWAQEPNRRTLPFAWGLEHIGGDAKEPDPRGFLDQFVEHTLAHSDEWYAVNLLGRQTILCTLKFFARGIPGRRWLCWRNGTRGGKSNRTFAAGSIGWGSRR
ncbi:MAG: hypothetical protein ABSB66_16655 [Candidatus Acidiferrales bacterium]